MAQKLNLTNLAVSPVTHRSNFPSTFTFGVATSAYQVYLSLSLLDLNSHLLLSRFSFVFYFFVYKFLDLLGFSANVDSGIEVRIEF